MNPAITRKVAYNRETAIQTKFMNTETTPPRYQDYVIKDGQLVGDFETMYQKCSDPWVQSKEQNAPDKYFIAGHLVSLGVTHVVEMGCGHGHYTETLRCAELEPLGVDISPTAIMRARELYPECTFKVGDVLDIEQLKWFAPQAIILSEITWYTLDKMPRFIRLLAEHFPGITLAHLLVTYPPGVQQYGKEHFTDLPGIMNYFTKLGVKMRLSGCMQVHGEITTRTFFVGQIPHGNRSLA